MNEEQEATWVLIHAKICTAYNSRTSYRSYHSVFFSDKELKLLREQMPNLLESNKT